jgi:catechol 2,3-dioxygenase-like lactoylglutathione lyase family enzyme
VRAIALNHVSIPTVEMEESVRFYKDCFGMEEIPAPRFGFGRPVRWLRLGDLQLHLFPVDELPPRSAQHFGLEVDDFAAAYRALKERGIFSPAGERAPAAVWELPGGEGQMYFRDPAGNLVEIDCPDLSAYEPEVFGDDLRRLSDDIEQSPENLRARLSFIGERSAV